MDATPASQRVNSYWNSPLCVAEYDQTHAQGIGVERDDQLWKTTASPSHRVQEGSITVGCTNSSCSPCS